MDIRDFKAGSYSQQYQYKSFTPSKVNENWVWIDPKLNTLLAEANRKLGELNVYSCLVPDVDYYIRMHVVKEATTSSRIEGTKTEIEEALLKESDVLPEKRDDWQEVQNYIEAMNYAIAKLKEVPISTRLLKDTHRTLLSKGRGEKKEPGEYRRSQNRVGGSTLNNAEFIPPRQDEISNLMGDLENFLHNDNIDVPHLVRIAIAHYQFETIHPFFDGNGRVGRLLITLYLVSKGLLAKPTLYLSDYLEKNRAIYYDNLMAVRTTNDIAQWIKFFLVAVIETATKGISTFEQIQKLRDEIEGKLIVGLGKRFQKAKELMNMLYRNPSITAASVAEVLNIVPATANSLIQDLVKLKILVEVTGGMRNRIFIFWDYVHLFSN